MRKTILGIGTLLIGGTFLLASCGSKGEVKRDADGKEVLSGYITLSGAFALYPLAIQWADEFHRLHPDVDIDISAGGAGKGITDVLADQVDIAMVSRELKPAEVEKGAFAYAVAKDAVVPTINAANPLYKELMQRGLTQEAAKGLWNGSIHSWGEVLEISQKMASANAASKKSASNTSSVSSSLLSSSANASSISSSAVSSSAVSSSPNVSKVNVYTRSDACGAAETWAKFLDSKQEDLKGTGVFGDPGIAETLQKDVNGIGFNNIGYAYNDKTHKPMKGIAILPIDVNKNGKIDADERFYDTMDQLMAAISEGRYPSPPARNLYLVTAGKSKNPVVREFLKYVITKGQKLTAPAGFVNINKEQQKKGLNNL